MSFIALLETVTSLPVLAGVVALTWVAGLFLWKKSKRIKLPWPEQLEKIERARAKIVKLPIFFGIGAMLAVSAILLSSTAFFSQETRYEGGTIDAAIAIDISGSMKSPELGNRDSRSEIAFFLVEKLIQDNPESNIMIMIFGTGSVIVSGPTDDVSVLLNSTQAGINLSQKNLYPTIFGGTNITEALFSLWQILKDQNVQNIPVILISDLDESRPPKNFQSALAELKSRGLRLRAIAVDSKPEHRSIFTSVFPKDALVEINSLDQASAYTLFLPATKEQVIETSVNDVANLSQTKVYVAVALLSAVVIFSFLAFRPIRFSKEEQK